MSWTTYSLQCNAAIVRYGVQGQGTKNTCWAKKFKVYVFLIHEAPLC